MTRVKIGQIWESLDARRRGQRFKVIGIFHAFQNAWLDHALVQNTKTRRRTKIKLYRLQCADRYRLVKSL